MWSVKAAITCVYAQGIFTQHTRMATTHRVPHAIVQN